jgi:ABC-type multidrug transport system ATPase subunit
MNLELQDLKMVYSGGKEALKGVNTTLDTGIYGLLGANGAGKSTLLKILTCNLKPTGGQVLYDGKPIQTNIEEYVSQIGYMPQQQGLYKEMTAVQFLTYMANLKGVSRADAKEQIPELLQRVNLESVARKRLQTFSGGMKQRILIAQAMLGNPKLLIFDEPTAGLDPKERIRVRNLISELSFDKIVIIATHVVTDIEFISKELLILKGGQLIQQGSVSQLLRQMEGLVYEVSMDMDTYRNRDDALLTSSVCKQDNGVLLRVVGERSAVVKALHVPCDITPVTPQLDDLYLYLFEEQEGGYAAGII